MRVEGAATSAHAFNRVRDIAAVSGGAQVYYAGADITATTLSRSSVAVDTYAPYLLQSSVPVTLVATSTYDSAQVATVNLLITN
jgi:hypothetical protein